jgi:hypothetical protein
MAFLIGESPDIPERWIGYGSVLHIAENVSAGSIMHSSFTNYCPPGCLSCEPSEHPDRFVPGIGVVLAGQNVPSIFAAQRYLRHYGA